MPTRARPLLRVAVDRKGWRGARKSPAERRAQPSAESDLSFSVTIGVAATPSGPSAALPRKIGPLALLRRRGRPLDAALMLRSGGRLADHVADLGPSTRGAAIERPSPASAHEALARRSSDQIACGSLQGQLTRLSFGGTPSSPKPAVDTAGHPRVSRCGRRPGASGCHRRATSAPGGGAAVEVCRARG
jgi:hypothetical protein